MQSPQREVTQSDRPSSGVSVASLHGLRARAREQHGCTGGTVSSPPETLSAPSLSSSFKRGIMLESALPGNSMSRSDTRARSPSPSINENQHHHFASPWSSPEKIMFLGSPVMPKGLMRFEVTMMMPLILVPIMVQLNCPGY